MAMECIADSLMTSSPAEFFKGTSDLPNLSKQRTCSMILHHQDFSWTFYFSWTGRSWKKIGTMAESPRPNETEISHSCQSPDAHTELSFLVSMEELIDKRLTHTKREDEKKSKLIDLLYNQVRLSNKERDEMVRGYEAEAQELSESKKTVLHLLKEKEDWHEQLWESKTELLQEKEQHLETLQKIQSLADQADKDLDLKQREITELQDRHRTEVGKLEEETASLKLACEDLQLRLNVASIQLNRQEEPWRKRCDALEKRHQRMLRDTILARRNANQDTQTALNRKFKAELARSQSLQAELEVFCEGFTTLENVHKLLMEEHALLQESNRLLTEDHALLEEICLKLKRKTLGIFGRRMQERNEELQKMKRKMRESQGAAQAQAAAAQAQAAQAETATGGSPHEAEGPRPLAPSCFLRRLEHLYD